MRTAYLTMARIVPELLYRLEDDSTYRLYRKGMEVSFMDTNGSEKWMFDITGSSYGYLHHAVTDMVIALGWDDNADGEAWVRTKPLCYPPSRMHEGRVKRV